MSPPARSPIWQAARLALGTASALGLARFAYGLLLPAMREDLRWSLAEAGGMGTANGLGYLLGALVTAVLVRRWGTAAVFRTGMALTAVSLGATAAGDDYVTLLAARVAAGATGAVVFIAGGVIASRIAVRAGSGTPITVYFAGTGLGIVLSGATIPALGEHWRVAWSGLAVAAALATAASWTATATEDDARAATSGRARVGALWGPALAYLLFAAGYITYITFLSAYLADRHASLGQVVLTWTTLGLAVVVAPALWSRPTGQWPGTRALATLLAVLGGRAALALVAPAPPVIMASALVYGATFMGVPAAVTALIKRHVPPADWTATLAAFTTVFAAGQTAGPWIAGVVADRTSTEATLAWTAILCIAAAVTAAAGGRVRRRPPRRVAPYDTGSPDEESAHAAGDLPGRAPRDANRQG
ncbi:YbfB/YjiJ family MFS transporter [Actinoallomurus purpureus]|uniref:YbfB/YjiJ family MFS transporter n=1 Tax=Actinoallomurus purpureus TaxID=478114 RepID=UPI00209240D0|nr:YbfB/YjiJ family MFS transporter [Actinoallomurus purpureus]MCO6010743.1 YbfB/YjiJ family MFS transporter [Actinoallomurus purpureus]